MKRLIRISLNTLISSLAPMLCWLLLGLTIDANLVNVFALTYPLQFVYGILVSIFATGANIKAEKEQDKNAVMNGMFLGAIVGAIIFGICAIFVKNYIAFMNMDVAIYKEFGLYSIISLFLQTLFSFMLEKWYFEDKEKLANIHCVAYNILQTGVLVITSLITKNVWVVIGLAIGSLTIYNLVLYIWQFKRFKINFNILPNLKYEAKTICENLLLFLGYLFGFSNAFEYGASYMVALNFVTLITDFLWDTIISIEMVAKIDLAKDKFVFKQHLKNAFILNIFIMSTCAILFFSLFNLYDVTLKIGLIYLTFQLIDFAFFPLMGVGETFVQLSMPPYVSTINTFVGAVTRTLLSMFLFSPFCTDIGQVVETFVVIIPTYAIIFANFKYKNGNFVKKEKKKIN